MMIVSPVPAGNPTYVGLDVLKDAGGRRTAVATAARLVTTPEIAEAVRVRLGLSRTRDSLLDAVEAKPVDDTAQVAVTVTDGAPARSAQLANAFVDATIAARSAGFQSELTSAIARVQQQLKRLPPAQRSGPQGEQLQRRLGDLKTLVGTSDPTLRHASQAVAPTGASWPRPGWMIFFGALIGLGVGVLLAAALGTVKARAAGRVWWRPQWEPATEERESALAERERQLGVREGALAQREKEVASALEELRAAAAVDASAAEARAAAAELEQQAAELDRRAVELERREAELAALAGAADEAERTEALAAQREEEAQRALAEREQALDELEREAARVTEALEARLADLARRDAQLEERVAAVTARERELPRRAAELAERERRLAAAEATLAERQAAQEAAASEPERIPEAPPAAERVQAPEPAPVPAGAAPAAAVDPGPWNLNDLQRLVVQHSPEYPERVDEWESYLFLLRDYADANGRVPSQFDWLIEDTFRELVGTR
jgi:hypothetical protein